MKRNKDLSDEVNKIQQSCISLAQEKDQMLTKLNKIEHMFSRHDSPFLDYHIMYLFSNPYRDDDKNVALSTKIPYLEIPGQEKEIMQPPQAQHRHSDVNATHQVPNIPSLEKEMDSHGLFRKSANNRKQAVPGKLKPSYYDNINFRTNGKTARQLYSLRQISGIISPKHQEYERRSKTVQDIR